MYFYRHIAFTSPTTKRQQLYLVSIRVTMTGRASIPATLFTASEFRTPVVLVSFVLLVSCYLLCVAIEIANNYQSSVQCAWAQ